MPKYTCKGRELLAVTRRGALKVLAALPFTTVAVWHEAAARTPSATEGPFYPTPAMRFVDADNDLVKIAGVIERAGGEVIILKGRVLGIEGKPVSGARVEIWQCDVNGRYLHTGDHDRTGSPRDPAFQGFGHVVTGPDGAYAFRTIKPVAYPGRTPHIHVKVIRGSRQLTTQFYIADHEQNAGDGLFRRMSVEDQRGVSMVFSDGNEGQETTVDITL